MLPFLKMHSVHWSSGKILENLNFLFFAILLYETRTHLNSQGLWAVSPRLLSIVLLLWEFLVLLRVWDPEEKPRATRSELHPGSLQSIPDKVDTWIFWWGGMGPAPNRSSQPTSPPNSPSISVSLLHTNTVGNAHKIILIFQKGQLSKVSFFLFGSRFLRRALLWIWGFLEKHWVGRLREYLHSKCTREAYSLHYYPGRQDQFSLNSCSLSFYTCAILCIQTNICRNTHT